jgi:hypothetical protein
MVKEKTIIYHFIFCTTNVRFDFTLFCEAQTSAAHYAVLEAINIQKHASETLNIVANNRLIMYRYAL